MQQTRQNERRPTVLANRREILTVTNSISFWHEGNFYYHEKGDTITSPIVIDIIKKKNHLFRNVTIKNT